jgi:predicted N-acyltransferase
MEATARRQTSFAWRVVPRLADIDAPSWDALAGGQPFLRHAFLGALEESGTVAAATGWLPRHIVIDDAEGRLAAALPLYVKNHSYGEYVFDHGWAEAYVRAGGRYYPKLQTAVPFTPVPGPRLLVRPDLPFAPYAHALIEAAIDGARRHGASSWHVTFPAEAEWRLLGQAGLLLRTGEQFHWRNRGYATFDDFLAELASRKRKAIKRERRAIAELGIEIRCLAGGEVLERHWDAFFRFYQDTGGRKWGRPYLNRDFFRRLHAAMPESIVLVLAERQGRYIAGALNLRSADTLYGRYWGCVEQHPFLHFECCYYQAIDYAIRHRLGRVEAGAQGEHKLARGYVPVATYSAHWIADDGFRRAVSEYLVHERRAVAEAIAGLAGDAPFRKDRPAP